MQILQHLYVLGAAMEDLRHTVHVDESSVSFRWFIHGFNSFTVAPSAKPAGQSTTTFSPSLKPVLIVVASLTVLATVTARRSTRWSRTTMTTSRPSCW